MKASPGRSDGSIRTGASTEPRRDETAHDLAVGELEPLGVLGREVERLAAVQRRAVEVRLHAGVVRLEPPAGREPDRVLGVERLERRPRASTTENGAGGPAERRRPRAARAGTASRDASSSGHGHWMPPSSSSRA